jgi:hypothetical protein
MNLSQQHQQPVSEPTQEDFTEQAIQQQLQEQEQAQTSPPITYASTHYTHSYHVAPVRQAAPAAEKTHMLAAELGAILMQNSIDPTLLFPSQIDLFQNADNDQRLRLLELWRISPPQGRQGIPQGVDYNTSRQLYDWPPTSLAQEEAMAKLRYEHMMQERVQSEEIQNHQQQLDQSMDQARDSAAVLAAQGLLANSPESSNAEPYVVSGYDMLARREYEESAQIAANQLRESTKYNQATDPVYNHSGVGGGLWEKNVKSIMDMENQYGALACLRDYDVGPVYADEEMVM